MSNKYPGGFVSLGGPKSNSNYFYTSYLTVTGNSGFNFGTSDFTVEAFVYVVGFNVFWPIVDARSVATLSNWAFGLFNSSQNIDFIYGATRLTSSLTVPTGKWTHVAVTRSSGTLRLFINGVLDASTASYSSAINAAATNPIIGKSQDPYYAYGNISNLRINTTTAIYTSSFTPPTGQLQNISGTSFLTCQSSTIVDNSSNAFTLTNTGVFVDSATPFQSYNPNNLDPALGAATPGMWTLSQALNAQVTRSWPMYDPYYRNVVLNLHGDGTNGAQNNTFLDSSTNNFTITRNGNTTQGTFSPYGQGWSNYFVVGTGSIDFPTTSNLNLTGNFTIDFWFNLSSIPTTGYIFSGTGSTIQLASGNLICYDGAQQPILTAPAANTWYYIALVRSGTTVTPYVNGVAGTPFTNSSTTVFTHSGGRLGAGIPSGASPINGYLSNYRVSNTARTISLQTAPPVQDANTLALVCASNRFNDLGINNLTLTVGSSVSVQRFSPFLFPTSYTPSTIGGSGYFDGTGDYLTVPDNAALQMGSSSFCIECWIYSNTTSGANVVVSKWNNGGTGDYILSFEANQKIVFFTGIVNITSTNTYSLKAWHHIAAVRNGSNFALFIDGVRDGTGTSASSLSNSGTVLGIGANTGNSFTNNVNGYVCDVRIVKGSSVYDPTSSTITIPTAPLTAISNTSLLTSYTNSGIVDNAMMNDLETVGNAQISTSVKKYGTGSMYFDGTGDFLATKLNVPLILNSDFTIEAWVYPTTITGSSRTVYFLENGGNSSTFYITSAGILSLDIAGVANYALGSATVSINSWQHIVFVRSGTTLTGYINGVSSGTATVSASIGSSGAALVGANSNAGGAPFAGYIDDLRVTKGVARYVANFTPPTSQLQDQ